MLAVLQPEPSLQCCVSNNKFYNTGIYIGMTGDSDLSKVVAAKTRRTIYAQTS